MGVVNGEDVVLLTGNSVPDLAQSVSRKLKIPLSDANVERFNDGEVQVQIGKKVALRGKTVFIIQSTFPPAENWLEMWLLADAAHLAGAKDIIWLATYMGYARQDRKIAGHDPISAAMVLRMTVAAGVTQIIAVDLHCGQIQGFENIPFANLWGRKLILRHILKMLDISSENKKQLSELAIIAPDPGSYYVASHYASKFSCILIGGLKIRSAPGEIEEIVLVGGEKAEGRTCIILDEMIDTAGTIIGVAEKLESKKADRILVGTTHPLLSGSAVESIDESPIEKVVVADTIPLKKSSSKIEVVTVATELATAIEYVTNKGIVSGLAGQL